MIFDSDWCNITGLLKEIIIKLLKNITHGCLLRKNSGHIKEYGWAYKRRSLVIADGWTGINQNHFKEKLE